MPEALPETTLKGFFLSNPRTELEIFYLLSECLNHYFTVVLN